MLLLLFFITLSNISRVEVVSITIPSYLLKHKIFLSCPPKKLKLSSIAYLTNNFETECHKRNEHFQESSWTIVREASVDRSYAFLDVPDGTLYSVYVHTGS